MTAMHGAACFKPHERWVFVSEPGEVYVVGQGDDGYEEDIDGAERDYFKSVKCIAGGYCYAVGLHRRVFRREEPNRWVALADEPLRPAYAETTREAA